MKLTAPLPGVSSCIGAVSCGVFEVTLVETVEVLAESFVVEICLNFFNCLRYNSLNEQKDNTTCSSHTHKRYKAILRARSIYKLATFSPQTYFRHPQVLEPDPSVSVPV